MKTSCVCIICPKGCELEGETDGQEILSLEGASCPRGREYLAQELRDPRRTITSTVLVEGGESPLVSVRLSAPVPKNQIFAVMEAIRRLRVVAPVSLGEVLLPDLLRLGCDLIATHQVFAAEKYGPR